MKEIRSITGNIETRSIEGETTPTISGYACVFDKLTDMGWYLERVDRSAFNGCDMSETIAAFNHEEEELLSRVTGNEGDLSLTVDNVGLAYEFKAKNECAMECAQNISLGFIKGSSFAFTVTGEAWEYDVAQADGTVKDVRTILSIGKLYDVSPVVFPAYPQTSAEARELRSRADEGRPKPVKQKDKVDIKLEILKTK